MRKEMFKLTPEEGESWRRVGRACQSEKMALRWRLSFKKVNVTEGHGGTREAG